ncbi:hypothetical protein EG329_005106 [Mollisiaceae sp. DMI_Dod_QoI]|nr:hypothetical protein EG329_005106 [Helotiales sp. DMI_Dod_QoI]
MLSPPIGSPTGKADRPRNASPNPIILATGTRSGLSILRWWIPEIVTSFLSIAALLAIVIVLRVYANRSLNDVNLPFELTLNGLVAALSARHGYGFPGTTGNQIPEVGFKTLRYRTQHLEESGVVSFSSFSADVGKWLALFGAVVTVLSLSINTFTQQLVSIQGLPVNNISSPLNPGNIPRSEIYNGTGSDLQESFYEAPLNVLAPVNAGFFAEAVLPVAPTCPTGNCTYPNTPTLAICGECAPITSQKTLCDQQKQFCNYTTPSGSNFSILDHNATTPAEGIGMFSTTTLGQHWNASSLDTLYLANWDMMYFPYGITSKQSPNSTLNAVECAMWMCVNTYSTTVQSGVFQQQLISSYSRTNLSIVEGQATTFQDGWIERFTTTLTNHVRTAVPGSKVLYDGTAFQLGIVVRWWWLALPVAMVAMSMLLLTLVIIQTARSEVKSWKASPLTLLLFDVDGVIRKDMLETGWPNEEGAAEKGVGDRGVVLQRDKSGGWYFTGA